MAYSDGCDPKPPRVNHFSNPDIDYLGLPTGTATDDNARCIETNMVRHCTLEFCTLTPLIPAALGEPTTAHCFFSAVRELRSANSSLHPRNNLERFVQVAISNFRTGALTCADIGEMCTTAENCCSDYCGSAGVCGKIQVEVRDKLK